MLGDYEFNDKANYSDVTKELAFLKKKNMDAHSNIPVIKGLMSDHNIKRQIASAYIREAAKQNQLRSLEWIERIRMFFSSPKK